MEDQFRRVHTDQEFLGKTIILVGSDGGGSEYNKKWAIAIDNKLKNEEVKYEVNWLPVADVSAAPFFMKGYVRNRFPKDKKKWALCDWEGAFDEAYGFRGGLSNILVFHSSGKLLYQCAGDDVDSEILDRIVAVVEKNY
jgi:hypothetical protein